MAGEILNQAISLAKGGKKPEARRLLESFLRENPLNETGWIWMTDVLASDSDRRSCLEKVLAINPANAIAREGLKTLGATASESSRLAANANPSQQGPLTPLTGGGNSGTQNNQLSPIVTLSCPKCGGKLQITSDLDCFACAYCGQEHIVQRGGGIVSLNPVVERLDALQSTSQQILTTTIQGTGATQKVAAEIALERIKKQSHEAAQGCWGGVLIVIIAVVLTPILARDNPIPAIVFLIGVLAGIASFVKWSHLSGEERKNLAILAGSAPPPQAVKEPLASHIVPAELPKRREPDSALKQELTSKAQSAKSSRARNSPFRSLWQGALLTVIGLGFLGLLVILETSHPTDPVPLSLLILIVGPVVIGLYGIATGLRGINSRNPNQPAVVNRVPDRSSTYPWGRKVSPVLVIVVSMVFLGLLVSLCLVVAIASPSNQTASLAAATAQVIATVESTPQSKNNATPVLEGIQYKEMMANYAQLSTELQKEDYLQQYQGKPVHWRLRVKQVTPDTVYLYTGEDLQDTGIVQVLDPLYAIYAEDSVYLIGVPEDQAIKLKKEQQVTLRGIIDHFFGGSGSGITTYVKWQSFDP